MTHTNLANIVCPTYMLLVRLSILKFPKFHTQGVIYIVLSEPSILKAGVRYSTLKG